jgi:hypothetical protein
VAPSNTAGAARGYVAYTLIATFALPALWADPFGSLLKNVTVLAATLALLAVED